MYNLGIVNSDILLYMCYTFVIHLLYIKYVYQVYIRCIADVQKNVGIHYT